MALNDLFRVRFRANVAKQPCNHTLHWRQDNSGTVPTDDAVLALSQLLATPMANWQFPFGNDYTFEGWDVSKLDGDPLAPRSVYTNNVVGTQTSQSLPAFKCALVRLTQIETMAKHNGRVFLSGVGEDATTGNTITSAVIINGINSLFVGLRDLSGSVGGVNWAFKMVVVEQRPPGGGPYTHHDVGPVQCQSIIYSQRRRMTRENGYVAA